jgi:transposase
MRFGPTTNTQMSSYPRLTIRVSQDQSQRARIKMKGMDMEHEKIEYAAWIGIDWGSEKHAVCLQAENSDRIESCILEQKTDVLHAWFMNLLVRFGGRKIAVAIEQSKGAVVNFLLGLDFVHIFRIHPKSLKNYRDALYPSGAKDDPVDAELIMQFAKFHQDKILPWIPDAADSRLLMRLVEYRRKTVNKRVRLTNELTQLLKEYFPQALDLVGDLDHVMACNFLLQWPTLQKLQKCKPEIIRQFYRKHGCRHSDLIENRLEQIYKGCPLTTDKAILESSVLMVRTIIPQLHMLIDAIARFDERIEEVYHKQPDSEIFSSFPGAGKALAPRLQAAMGSDRDRFKSPQEVAEYSGIAPVVERSGKSQWIHRRFACSRFVKQSFHEFAGQSIAQCEWAKAFYDSKKAGGMEHHAALRALAYKWIRIIFRCWHDQVPYDEEKYLQGLRRKCPSWLEFMPKEV